MVATNLSTDGAQAGVSISDLAITFPGPNPKHAVSGVSLTVEPGERIGLVGESGAGKTLLGLSLIGLVPKQALIHASELKVGSYDLLTLGQKEATSLRGGVVGMVFQNPMTGFNPVRTIGSQMQRTVLRHQQVTPEEARNQVMQSLADVGLPAKEERYNAYPHQLSGGQLQRAMIAQSLINSPELLIADEPTTALDATVQAQILDLLSARLTGRSLVLITHDLAVAAQLCDRMVVLRDGEVVESGHTRELLASPQAEYTKQLLSAAPSLNRRRAKSAPKTSESRALLTVDELRVHFPGKSAPVRAVRGVSLAIKAGETLALVGESGSGKSTIALSVMGAVHKTSGTVTYSGKRVGEEEELGLREFRRRVQLILQDPYGTLDPRWTVERIVAEPLKSYGIGDKAEQKQRAQELLKAVELPGELSQRKPRQLSGGQRQRVAIARALALEPDLLLADEPVSALDMSVQAQIVQLLLALQQDRNLALLLISHDLALVHEIADTVAVLYLGKIMETGPAAAVIGSPIHPYTGALRAAVPTLDEESGQVRLLLEGEPPSPIDPPPGCPFSTRCPKAQTRCESEAPLLEEGPDGRKFACFFPNTDQ